MSFLELLLRPSLKSTLPALLPAALLSLPQVLLWSVLLEQPFTPQILTSPASAVRVGLLFLFTWLGLLAGQLCPAGLPTRSQRASAALLTAGAGAVCCLPLTLCLLRLLDENFDPVPKTLDSLYSLAAVPLAWALAVFFGVCFRKNDRDTEAPIMWQNTAAPLRDTLASGRVLSGTTLLVTALTLLLLWGAGFLAWHPLAVLFAALGTLLVMLFAPLMPERVSRDNPSVGPWVLALLLLTLLPLFLGAMLISETERLGKTLITLLFPDFAMPTDFRLSLAPPFLVAYFVTLLVRVLCREAFLRDAQDRLQNRMAKQASREAQRAREDQATGFLCGLAENRRPLVIACLVGLLWAAGLGLLFFFRVLALEPQAFSFCWFGVLGCLLAYAVVSRQQSEEKELRKLCLLIDLLVAVARAKGPLQELERNHILHWFDPATKRRRWREKVSSELEAERRRGKVSSEQAAELQAKLVEMIQENPENLRDEDERERLRLRALLKQAESSPRSLASLLSAWDAQPEEERRLIALEEVFRLVYLRKPPAPDGLALARTIARRFGVSDFERLLMEAEFTDIDQKSLESALERVETTENVAGKEGVKKKVGEYRKP